MNLQVFTYQHNARIRVIMRDGAPWWVAQDVAFLLGYRDAHNAMRILFDDEKDTHKVSTPGGEQNMTIVSESGLFALILRSNRPEAQTFRKWVTSEVLPEIRRTGAYQSSGLQEIPKSYSEALRALADEVEEKSQLQLANSEMKPKAAFYDAVIQSPTTFDMNTAAKILNFPGYGRTKLFQFLREKKVLMRDNLPYQEHIEAGRFEVSEREFYIEGEVNISRKTVVTQKGLDYIRKLLLKERLRQSEESVFEQVR